MMRFSSDIFNDPVVLYVYCVTSFSVTTKPPPPIVKLNQSELQKKGLQLKDINDVNLFLGHIPVGTFFLSRVANQT